MVVISGWKELGRGVQREDSLVVSFLGENKQIIDSKDLRRGDARLACSFPMVDNGESLGWWSVDGFWLGIEMVIAKGRR